MSEGCAESQKFVIENRAVFERAGQAVMAKIMENEKAAAALPLTGPGRVAIPDHQRAGSAEGSGEAQGVMASAEATRAANGASVRNGAAADGCNPRPAIPLRSKTVAAYFP